MHTPLTDRHELATLGALLREGIAERRAVFELSVRQLPPQRRFVVVAGLDRAVRLLRDLRFDEADLAWVRSAPGLADVASEAMLNYLREFTFRGDLDAVPEGEVVFAREPVLRVEASLAECVLLESLLVGAVSAETRVASKAVRVVLAAAGRAVLDLGARSVDPAAAPWIARAAYVAGCAATSCEAAGARFGVPVTGGATRAWPLAHVDDGEAAAFQRFAAAFSAGVTLAVDALDARQGALHALTAGTSLRALRVSAGDLDVLGRDLRRILDAAGRPEVQLVAGDDLDEHHVRALVEAAAPFDAFAVGPTVALSPDAPALATWELVEVHDRRGVRTAVSARAPGLPAWAGPRQVWRRTDARGTFLGDVVARRDESPDGDPSLDGATPLLAPVMRMGKLLHELPDPATATAQARARAARAVASLPPALRALDDAPDARAVRATEALEALARDAG